MAASPPEPLPRAYSKVNDDEYTSTLADCHELPWLPLLLHLSAPAASFTRSVPMREPYMWYLKTMVVMMFPAAVQTEPS